MKIETKISWGYRVLIDIFGQANNLDWKLKNRDELEENRSYITIFYDDDSDTAGTLSFLALKHLGIENMLCDYLIKCNVDPILIPIGQFVIRKTPEQMEKDWQEQRRKLGFYR